MRNCAPRVNACTRSRIASDRWASKGPRTYSPWENGPIRTALGLNPETGKEIMRNELVGYTAFIEFSATIALAIGVLGTVIGLILGFANVDPTLLSNVANAGPTVAEVLKGLSVAFHTTLVGGVANLWLRTNHFMLEQASVRVYNSAIAGK